MDIAIPLSADSNNDFLDLRYALRGLEKFVEVGKVWLIGGKPAWLQGVEHIPANDYPNTDFRERSIFEKLLLCPSEEFLYFSDDNYLLEPWREIYPYDKTILSKFYSLPRNSTYKLTVANTLRIAPQAGNYDVHAPITMHRQYLHRLKAGRWDLPHGYCLKTLYAQVARITGTEYADLKFRTAFREKDIRGRKWFSTADGIVDKVVPLMNKLYPKKSKYEV